VRGQFQLTFDEYAQAMRLIRRRLVKNLRRGSRVEFWVGLAVVAIVIYFFGWIVDRMMATPATSAAAVAQLPWQEGLRPYVYFVGITWIVCFATILRQRRRIRRIDRLQWESRPQFQQIRTVEVSESAVVFEDIFARSEYHWPIFRHVEETPTVFILFLSEHSAELLAKRAFADGEIVKFRELAREQIQSAGPRGFPISQRG
jgi:hypothetical protein